MARCNDCNKFVAYGEPEIEEQDSNVDEYEATAEVRMALTCEECGTELKEFTFEMLEGIGHECAKAMYEKHIAGLDAEEIIDYEDAPEYEIIESDNWEATDRYEDKDKHGKPIKNPRYMKHFYGVTGCIGVKCLKCGEEFTVELSGEAQASEFDDCW